MDGGGLTLFRREAVTESKSLALRLSRGRLALSGRLLFRLLQLIDLKAELAIGNGEKLFMCGVLG